MSLLETVPNRVNGRPSFPGEIDLGMSCISIPVGTESQIYCIGIDLQYSSHSLVYSNPKDSHSEPWLIAYRKHEPYLLSYQAGLGTGGIDVEKLYKSMIGLKTLLGDELAEECYLHFCRLVETFVPSLLDEGITTNINLRFHDLNVYYDLMLSLWERFTADKAVQFNREAARRSLTKPWHDAKYGPSAHLAFMNTCRPRQIGPQQDAHDASVASFEELIDMAATAERARPVSV